ncbi:MAG: HEAT repeat domain-containing protein [Anaerolineae bacterium]|nr:HEAT repeat domain-containing protein [Anaerolineae bacterium]
MSTSVDELERLLEQIAGETRPVAFSRLFALSDLAGERLKLFLAAWEDLPATRRRHLIEALADLAEASFEVNFDAIYRHSLGDPDDIVRATAIDGLWENEDPALIGSFLRLLRADPSALVRASAAEALGRYVLAGELEQLDAPIVARILSELLTCFYTVDEMVDVRCRAIESAAYACVPEVVDALEMAYDEEDERMNASAVFGMGRSCDRRWRTIILKELENDSPAMRYEAVRASGELGLRQAVPILARLIQDPDPQVHEASIWALGQIGGSDAKRILGDAYAGADEETVEALDEAVAEIALQEGSLDLTLCEIDQGVAGELLDDKLLDDEFWYEDEDEEDEEDEEDVGDDLLDDDRNSEDH